MKHNLRGVQQYNKDKSSESYDTTCTYISRQLSLEKSDKCNTKIYQFTSDKTGDRQNILTS
jgi:hypothetical protein